jgi:hypothetical protein
MAILSGFGASRRESQVFRYFLPLAPLRGLSFLAPERGWGED